MLTQQNLLSPKQQQQPQEIPNSIPLLYRIDQESSRIRSMVTSFRVGRKISHGSREKNAEREGEERGEQQDRENGFHFVSHNQSEISNIQPISEKLDRNSFDLDLQGQLPTKRNAVTIGQKFIRRASVSKDAKEGGDTGLKYRPRGAVNGRDDLRVRNLSQIHKKIVGTIQNNKHEQEQQVQTRKSSIRKISGFSLMVRQNPQSMLQQSPKHPSSTPKQPPKQPSPRKKASLHQPPTSTTLNMNPSHLGTALALDLQTTPIQPQQLLSYLQSPSTQQSPFPNSNSPPSAIYAFFMDICRKFCIEQHEQYAQPLIKRYRNCVYFGEKIQNKNSKFGKNGKDTYTGFVWYFRRCLYYGQFANGKKHGYGIEIDMEEQGNQSIWRGTFTNGKKTGYFTLSTPKLQYNGMVVNSFFSGEGMLTIPNHSVYKGTFQSGMKHGFGIETFQSKPLTYKGEYNQNKFQGNGILQGKGYYYKGLFRGGRQHGHGFERTDGKDGYEYQGEFKHGKMWGNGVLKVGGQVYKGVFQNGHLARQITFGDDNHNSHAKDEYNSISNSRISTNKTSIPKLQPLQKIPSSSPSSPSSPSQYTKSIKIQSFSHQQQQSSLSPSNILPKQYSMKAPTQHGKIQNRQNHFQHKKEYQKINANLWSASTSNIMNKGKISSRDMDTGHNSNNNINVASYCNKIVPLQKYLSKRLNSLYECTEQEQATIDHNKPLLKLYQIPSHDPYTINENGHQNASERNRNMNGNDSLPFSSHISRINDYHGHQDNCNYNQDADGDYLGEDQPLGLKLLPRE